MNEDVPRQSFISREYNYLRVNTTNIKLVVLSLSHSLSQPTTRIYRALVYGFTSPTQQAARAVLSHQRAAARLTSMPRSGGRPGDQSTDARRFVPHNALISHVRSCESETREGEGGVSGDRRGREPREWGGGGEGE